MVEVAIEVEIEIEVGKQAAKEIIWLQYQVSSIPVFNGTSTTTQYPASPIHPPLPMNSPVFLTSILNTFFQWDERKSRQGLQDFIIGKIGFAHCNTGAFPG